MQIFTQTIKPSFSVERILSILQEFDKIYVWSNEYGSIFIKAKTFEMVLTKMVDRFFIQISGIRNDEYLDNKVYIRILPNETYIGGYKI